MSAVDPKQETGRLGRFIQTYSGFLSSFVIGVAGLVATSIWQHKQADIAARQAASEQEMATIKALNDWRIARAEILAKNLDVLAAQGPISADRRYGVLLSLTRGGILDPELAVSYALELGKDNASYMRSVLESAPAKNYMQLAQAFALTCVQRFGVERAEEVCRDDRLADRSSALALLAKDELEASLLPPTAPRDQPRLSLLGPASAFAVESGAASAERSHPLSLLTNEDDVHNMPAKLAWFFEPYLQDQYEHRRWKEIERFEAFSPGARLVAALVLATARTGEMLGEAEARQSRDFHDARRKWLTSYLLGRSCDAECRARVVDYMLSTVRESDSDYEPFLRELLVRSRAEAGRAVNLMHARLLWCQIDAEDLALLRDRVLVPAALGALKQPGEAIKRDPTVLDDLIGLLALTPPPLESPESWRQLQSGLASSDRLAKLLTTRAARARADRADPPPMIRRMNLCAAPAGAAP